MTKTNESKKVKLEKEKQPERRYPNHESGLDFKYEQSSEINTCPYINFFLKVGAGVMEAKHVQHIYV